MSFPRFAALAALNLALAALATFLLKSQTVPAQAQVRQMEEFVACSEAGQHPKKRPWTKGLAGTNRLKNRFESPTAFSPSVTMSALAAPGDDRRRWTREAEQGVRITGYVAFAVQNPSGESCNCYKKDDAHSDTHIDLVQNPLDTFILKNHVIVEVTPRMKYFARLRGLDWSTTGLQRKYTHKWITVEGWLFWDSEHVSEASNTHSDDPNHRNWRRTCWEIHPVAAIKL